MMNLYYIIIFLLSFMIEDFKGIILFYIGTFKIYLIDIVYLMIAISTFSVILDRDRRPNIKESFGFTIFLLWLVWGIIYGIPLYGLRALGEGRVLVYGLFSFFIPFVLPIEKKPSDLAKVLSKTLFVAGMGAAGLFIVEIINGGRFFFAEINLVEFERFVDFRGLRILGSEQTYNLGVMVLSIIFGTLASKYSTKTKIIFGIILMIMILVTRNRAATISLLSALIIFFLLQGRLKLIAKYITVIILLSFLTSLIIPNIYDNLKSTFAGVTDLTTDPSGRWRLMVQAAAIEEAMQHPLIGQGLGGYFSLYIPELNIIEEAPPHSEYVYLFLKTGIIGVILAIIPIVLVCRKLLIYRKNKIFDEGDVFGLLFVLLASQLIYSLAYGFTLFYGIYYGFAVLLLRSFDDESKKMITDISSR